MMHTLVKNHPWVVGAGVPLLVGGVLALSFGLQPNEATADPPEQVSASHEMYGHLGEAPFFSSTVSVEAADLNEDGLLDVAVARAHVQRLDIYLAVDENTFGEPLSYPCVTPAGVAMSDLDADGLADVAIASTSAHAVVLMRNEGDGSLAPWTEIPLPGAPNRVTILDILANGPFPEILIGDGSDTPMWLALYDEAQAAWIVYDVEELERRGIFGWSDCGPEPNCSETPGGPGVQACMAAARCRAFKCDWAACTLHEQGEAGWLETAAAHLACATIEEAELVGCLGAVIPLK